MTNQIEAFIRFHSFSACFPIFTSFCLTLSGPLHQRIALQKSFLRYSEVLPTEIQSKKKILKIVIHLNFSEFGTFSYILSFININICCYFQVPIINICVKRGKKQDQHSFIGQMDEKSRNIQK